MAEIGDAVEEFKKMPTAGKVAVGIAAIAVAGIALYLRARNSATTASTVGTAASGSGLANLPATSNTSGSTASGPGTGTGTGTTTTPPPTGTTATTPGSTTYIGNPPHVPVSPKISTYVVQHGDNLSEIASKLGIKGGWQALYNQNKAAIGSNPNLIYAGTNLNITGLT